MKPRDEAKEAAIKRATLDLVGERGIVGVKMSHVAQQAGIATGTLYIYYPNKAELLRAVYVEQTQQLASSLLGKLPADLPFKVAFRKLVEGFFLYSVKESKSLFFIDQYKHSSFAANLETNAELELKGPFLQILDRGQAEMLVREEDSNLLLAVVNGIVSSVAHHCACEGIEPDAGMAKLIAQIAWDAVKS